MQLIESKLSDQTLLSIENPPPPTVPRPRRTRGRKLADALASLDNCGSRRLSHVAAAHRLRQRNQRGGVDRQELLADVAFVAGGGDRFHDRRIVEFLAVVEFVAAGNAGRMVMADVFVELTDARDHVSFHDLHVIDIVEQFQPWAADAADDFDRPFDLVAEIIGMALSSRCSRGC